MQVLRIVTKLLKSMFMGRIDNCKSKMSYIQALDILQGIVASDTI